MNQRVNSQWKSSILLAAIMGIATLFMLANIANAANKSDHYQLVSKYFLFLPYQGHVSSVANSIEVNRFSIQVDHADESVKYFFDVEGVPLASPESGILMLGVFAVDGLKGKENSSHYQSQVSRSFQNGRGKNDESRNQVSNEGVLSGRYNLAKQADWKKRDKNPFFYPQNEDDRSYIF